ncbi:MAG: LysR family transcriptional regulator [Burkholderiales bacterium]|nr:LysR family transcriptional regulator [Burkholderiales bacterium]
MQLHQLKYFVSVVKTGSITKAANACFISQPSLSQQLKKLEDSIGKRLFSRIEGRLVLTDPGQILYEHACKILGSVGDAKNEIKDIDQYSGGSVRVGILPTLAPFMLPKTLAILSQKYPRANVLLREEISETLIKAASCGELDILIEVLPFDQSNLKVEPLFFDTFYLAVHQDNPLADLKEVHVSQLDEMPFILLEDIHCLTRQIEHYCFTEHFIPKAVFQASQIGTIKLLIESQYGVSILPSISITHEADSKIRYINLTSEHKQIPTREVVLAVSKDRYLGPAAKQFIKIIKEQYQNA